MKSQNKRELMQRTQQGRKNKNKDFNKNKREEMLKNKKGRKMNMKSRKEGIKMQKKGEHVKRLNRSSKEEIRKNQELDDQEVEGARQEGIRKKQEAKAKATAEHETRAIQTSDVRMGLGQSLLLPNSPIDPRTLISMITGKMPKRLTDPDDELVDLRDYQELSLQKIR